MKHSRVKNVTIEVNLQKLKSKKSFANSVIGSDSGMPQKDLDVLFTLFRQGSNITEPYNRSIWIKNCNKKGVSVSFSCQQARFIHE